MACLSVASTKTVHAYPSTTAPGFAEPTVSGIQGSGFEDDVRLDNSASTLAANSGQPIIYQAAPQSLSSSVSTVWRSMDGGQTFKLIPAQTGAAAGYKVGTCPGGGDVELGTDSSGNLYQADLTLANFSVWRSGDHGNTLSTGVEGANCAGVPQTVVDRQWYATYGDPTNGGYLALASDEVDQNGNPLNCPSTSPASTGNALVLNLSPASASGGSTGGLLFGPAQVGSCDEGIMGNDEMFNYGASAGGLKVFDVHDDNALNSISMVRCDVVGVSATATTGFSNCIDQLVASFPGGVTGANFPTMAVDDQGGLFVVWEQAPGSGSASITGNTQLYFSTSSNQGLTWSAAKQIPTPGLDQDVMAWPGAGDSGRIDVAFYGAPEAWQSGDTDGPDSIIGHYGLYMVQTLDDGTSWSAPVLASEHFVHYGTQYTLIGGQNGSRTQGDFLQLRIGPQGEANISFSDSNNQDSGGPTSQGLSEGMFVRQNSGPSVYANENGNGTVSLPAKPSGNCVSDPSGDATYDANGSVGTNNPDLDITQACLSQPDATHYSMTMTVVSLSSLTGPATAGSAVEWGMQWHVPSHADTSNGGALFEVYMESVEGGAVSCYAGQNGETALGTGGGIGLTYPGSAIPSGGGDVCSEDGQTPGHITITFPISMVTEPNPDSSTLYSVTASTQMVNTTAETPPNESGLGGELPNLIDVAPAFDFTQSAPNGTPEAPWTPLLLLAGLATATAATWYGRRRWRNSAI